MPLVDEKVLRAAIKANKARWVPKASRISRLPDAARANLLGVEVDRSNVDAIAAEGAGARAASAAAAPLPTSVDWRNRNGRNFISPVKDQLACGSCVSFCSVALLEATAAIERNISFLDLSEADLHFCSSHGATCGGWWPTNALDQLKTRGVVDEASFPYATAFQPGGPRCVNVPDRAAHTFKVGSYTTLSTMADRKRWLADVGPVSAVFHVYDDFFMTGTGVYSHVTGGHAGYHCVEVVGYSDAEGCWICKNSWSTTWGDRGFFKIAYGQCGIDETSTDKDGGTTNRFPMWGAQALITSIPAAVGDAFGYAFVNNGTGLVEQHNLFRSADGHIQALWFNFSEGWHHEDRSTFLPGIPPSVGSPSAYAFINNGIGVVEQHNLFVSADGHVHALWFNFAEGWHHEDRTTLLPGVPASAGNPFGYAFINEPTGLTEQHNLFRSADGHVHALWFNFAEGWHHEDRSTILPGVPRAVGDPFGYAFVNNATGLVEQHNLFRSGDGHVHALWFNFSEGWHHEDRSTILPGVPAAVGEPFGYAFINGRTGLVEQHNLCRSADGHIHALWFNFAEGWHHEDRTTLLPGIPPAVGNPFGYAFVNDSTGIVEQHNLFRSADGHIHALWFNFSEGWHHEDRSTLLPGIPPAVGEPFGYAFINKATGLVEQHNLFRSADGHIHALWFNFSEGWHHEDRSII